MQKLVVAIHGKKDSGKSLSCQQLAYCYLTGRHSPVPLPGGAGADALFWMADNKVVTAGPKQGDAPVRILPEGIPSEELEAAYGVVIRPFARPLKQLTHDWFGVPLELLYGSNADKDKLTAIPWSSVPADMADRFPGYGKASFLSVRELLQYVGDWARRVNVDVFVNSLLSEVARKDTKLTLVPDMRYLNEFTGLSSVSLPDTRIVFIKLLRCATAEDSHPSEAGIILPEGRSWDLVLPADITIEDQLRELRKFLSSCLQSKN